MAVPIACALDQPQLLDRMESWDRLRVHLLAEAEPLPDGVWLDFAPQVLAELLELVVAERACCGWAEWTVTSTSRRVRLDVVAGGAGALALHVMFGVAS